MQHGDPEKKDGACACRRNLSSGYIEIMYSLYICCTNVPKKSKCLIRIYHNHTLQTNPWHLEEEPHNANSHMKSERQFKVTSSLFSIKMIAKLERTPSIAQKNTDQTLKPHK